MLIPTRKMFITQINNNVTIETSLKKSMYDSLVRYVAGTGKSGKELMLRMCNKKTIRWWDVVSVYKDVYGIRRIAADKGIIRWFQENIKGYNPMYDVTNRTPLFYIPCRPIVSAYINMPHQVDVQDRDGNTAMHYISKVGLSAFFRDIVDLNPNVNIKNNNGKYAMNLFLPGTLAHRKAMCVFKYLYKNTVYGASADIKKYVLNIVKHNMMYYRFVDPFLTHSLMYLVYIIRTLSKEDIEENFPVSHHWNAVKHRKQKELLENIITNVNPVFTLKTLCQYKIGNSQLSIPSWYPITLLLENSFSREVKKMHPYYNCHSQRNLCLKKLLKQIK